MIQPAFEILNQRGTPMFFSDVFANRPTAGIVGRIFISTDTYAFYRDTGSGWDLIGGPGTGTITGSGTIGTLPIWNGTQVIGDSSLLEGASKFTTTKDFQADGYYLSGMTAGSGALYWTSDRVTLANYNATGDVRIEVGGGQNAQTISGTNLSTTFYGNIIRNGGLSTQFLKADGSLDSNTYNTGSGAASQVAFWSGTNALTGENNLWWDSVNNHFGINTNTPGTAADIHHDQSTILQLNQTTATNDTRIAFQNSGSALWRIGNFYTAGANDWGIYDVVGAIQPFTIVKTTGQTFIGSKTTASGRLVVNNASSDAHIQVVGASAPSIRIDNAGTGATRRFVMGLATATNNFIQGSTAGDVCISTASASPLLFGMWQTINASEVMRISTANNLILGSTTDNGNRFQVTGNGYISGNFGLGVTLSPWSASPFNVMQIGTDGAFVVGRKDNGNQIQIGTNSYFDGTNWIYTTSNNAARFILAGMEFRWFNSPTGTAGSILGWTERMRLDSNGNLGLGLTPNSWYSTFRAFQFGGYGSSVFGRSENNTAGIASNAYVDSVGNFAYINSNYASYYQQLNSQHQWYIAPSGTAGNAITFTQAMTLDQNGRLSIGSTSPTEILELSTATDPKIRFVDVGNLDAKIGIVSSTALGFEVNGSERARITSGGNFLIGTTTDAGQKLQVSGTAYISGNTGIGDSGPSDVRFFIKGAGSDGSTFSIVARNSGNNDLFYIRNDGFINTGTQSVSPYNNSTTGRNMVIESGGGLGYLVSTRESKTNISYINNSNILHLLNPVSFNYRKKDHETKQFTDEIYDDISYGFIADEVEKIDENLVFYDILHDGSKKLAGVEYNKIIALLVKEIQEINIKLENRI